MSEKYGPFCLSKEMEEQRLMNLATVHGYIESLNGGPERYDKRNPLYTEDGRFQLTFSGGPIDDPYFSYSINDPRNSDNVEVVKTTIPYWESYGFNVLSTDDPHTFFLEFDGRGMEYNPSYDDEPRYYENRYIQGFTVKDGKIELLREMFNPYNGMRPRGNVGIPEGF